MVPNITPEETKSRGFIPELGVEIYNRDGQYYYDQIARGFQDGALGGGVAFGDSGAVARGHMHRDSQLESKPASVARISDLRRVG